VSATEPTAAELEVLRRLDTDTVFWAQTCMKIVDKRARRVPLVARPAQLRLDEVLERQRAAGLPMRAIVLKSRRTGISTWVQAKVLQRITRQENRRAQIVAHDGNTAGELFDIAWRAYTALPDEHKLKPGLIARRNTSTDRFLHFGNPSSAARIAGDLGLDSSLSIDTANEVESSRGLTLHDLHASEVGLWPDPNKAVSLMSTVADEPGTMIVVESTARGHNAFKSMWDRAMRGEGMFEPVFVGWTDDPDCFRPFQTDEARDQFIASIGTGPWGTDEPRLVEKFGCTPEQLYWRRTAIVDKAQGKLELFRQEYPSTPEEAFIASGKHVFSIEYISRVLDRVDIIEVRPPSRVTLAGPQEGLLMPTGTHTRKLAYGEMEVPTGATWIPREATGFGDTHPFWTLWRMPWPGIEEVKRLFAKGLLTNDEMALAHTIAEEPPGQYIVTMDPGGDEEASTGETAFNAIQVIDHRTGDQVARYASREDSDEMTRHMILAGMFFNEAWIAVEITGGWGINAARNAWKSYGYRRVYTRPRSADIKNHKTSDRLGWSTDRRTKPLIEETLREEMREGTDGIRDRETALELTTYVKIPPRNEHGPDDDAFADRLMALMIAKYLRTAIPLRPNYPEGQQYSSLTRDLP
jgi:hypothetical protein